MAKKNIAPARNKHIRVGRKSDPHLSRKQSMKPGPESALPTAEVKPDSMDSGSREFPIVGIGASAGGLDAFTDLLRALPPDLGMAYVFVQHLDPKHLSILTQLLSRETKLPVKEA